MSSQYKYIWSSDSNLNIANVARPPHPVWNLILCHWGALCFIAKEKWYFYGVGELLMNE